MVPATEPGNVVSVTLGIVTLGDVVVVVNDVVVAVVVAVLAGNATRPDAGVDDFFALVDLALTEVEIDFDLALTVPAAPDETGTSVRPISRTNASTVKGAKRVVCGWNTSCADVHGPPCDTTSRLGPSHGFKGTGRKQSVIGAVVYAHEGFSAVAARGAE